MTRRIAAVGDVTSPQCWSGTPAHFFNAARSAGFATDAWAVDLGKVAWPRRAWNAAQLLKGSYGGFQYSNRFLDLIEAQIPEDRWSGEILSVNPHFPRAASVARRGAQLSHYLDAPFAALVSGRGLELTLPRHVTERALDLERENFAASRRIVTMARWAAEVVRDECEVAAEKVHVILPGANLVLPHDWEFPLPEGRAGRERDFTLGFIGKDWDRKGLPLLIEVRDELARRGWRVRVLAAGNAPRELLRSPGLEFAGYLDKQNNPTGFLDFLARCDLGCLFSAREALGISTLEFLRAGVPVAGFAHEGMADTLPPDAGFRFAPGASASEIAEVFESYLQEESQQEALRKGARARSPQVTWERCLREFAELWETGKVTSPVQLWRE